MDPSRAGYDESGNLICQRCASQAAVAASNATIQERDPTSNRNLYGAAAASVLLGVATCCMSGLGRFFFVLCPMAVFIGGATIFNVLRDDGAKQRLGNGYFVVIGLSVVGALFGCLGTVLGLLGMVGAGLASH
jgi:hypothetical protein